MRPIASGGGGAGHFFNMPPIEKAGRVHVGLPTNLGVALFTAAVKSCGEIRKRLQNESLLEP